MHSFTIKFGLVGRHLGTECKWGWVGTWRPRPTCYIDVAKLQTPFPLPYPSDVKSNLRIGRMWLISDYILNEGQCWLVAFIGTLISNYCCPDVGRGRGVCWRVKDQSQGKGERKTWSERAGAEKGGRSVSTIQGEKLINAFQWSKIRRQNTGN